jgi:CBS domain-containing protein
MLTGVPTLVREDESLEVVLRKLLRQRATGVGIVDSRGDLVGIISERELTDWHDRVVADLARQEAPAPGEYARRLRTMTAASIMVRPGPALDASTPLGRATHLFRERGVARLPVTREGRLVGILTRTDVLRAMAARLHAEACVENPSD